jgi:GPI mannosyltransferase 3
MVKTFIGERVAAGPLRSGERAALLALFLLAAGLRLVPTLFYPSVNHVDEVYQTLEQAHRLVFGYGEVPWEFHVGARSWLLPGVLAGFMWLGDQIKDSPAVYLGAVHIALAALSATSIVCAFLWGRRHFGFAGGLVAAALPALWPDAVYFGARSLSECAAAPVLVAALYLVDTPARVSPARRQFAGGFFLGLAAALRIQLAPVVLLVLIWRLAEDGPRRGARLPLLMLVAGAASSFGAAGLLDAATWHYPFQSFWLNFDYNLVYGVADSFGTSPWSFYLVGLIQYWRWWFPVLFVLTILGGWRLPLPLAAAVVILATHSLIGHKEFRFIYPALLLIFIIAGIGLAQLVAWVGGRGAGARYGNAGAILAALGASGAFALSPSMQPMWRAGNDTIEAGFYVSRLPHLCAIGAVETSEAYAYFHRDVPYFWFRDTHEMIDNARGFDVVVTRESVPQGYTTLRCFGGVCVAQRQGSCAKLPPRPIFLTRPTIAPNASK